MYNYFIQRSRMHMHILMAMSPIGEPFRNRLRQYPSLINCTTIDWFLDWPLDALLEVAHRSLADVNFILTIVGTNKVSMIFGGYFKDFTHFRYLPNSKKFYSEFLNCLQSQIFANQNRVSITFSSWLISLKRLL